MFIFNDYAIHHLCLFNKSVRNLLNLIPTPETSRNADFSFDITHYITQYISATLIDPHYFILLIGIAGVY